MEIGQRIKEKRIELDMTQSELAEKVGMKQQSIGDIESGRVKKPRCLVDFAKVLGCSPEWLYYGNKKATNYR